MVESINSPELLINTIYCFIARYAVKFKMKEPEVSKFCTI